ncbi:MAG: penicillin-binding protein activator [Rhizobiales bacterium]|nr:penicillin-binding protein activator [Hyphomicrobiales bacterium]
MDKALFSDHPKKGLFGRLGLAALAFGLLAGCAGSTLETFGLTTTTEPTAPPAQAGDVIGTGAVKIALILPLSAPNGQAAALSLRNAAELAIQDFSGGNAASQNIQILVKDDRGTPDGARAATQEAIQQGAELILGPLFGPNVQAAAAVARPAGRSLIAFSSDASVAQRGVYLLSFLAQSDVQRIVNFAGSRGKKAIAALIPQTPYGSVVEAELMSVGNQQGRRVTIVERYQPGNAASLGAAVTRLKASISASDTLFIGEGADGLAPVMQALAGAGINGRQVQFISTGVWNDPRVISLPALDGAWFASPDNARFNQLAGRYQQRYGSAPTRLATLSYDAVTLASALTQAYGTQRFQDSNITNPNGFAGQDGVFRFRQNGLNDRGIAVFEIRGGSARAISAAPGSFAGN